MVHGDQGAGHAGHLAISLFIGRRTRVAASQQFDVANSARAQLVGLPSTGTASTGDSNAMKSTQGTALAHVPL